MKIVMACYFISAIQSNEFTYNLHRWCNRQCLLKSTTENSTALLWDCYFHGMSIIYVSESVPEGWLCTLAMWFKWPTRWKKSWKKRPPGEFHRKYQSGISIEDSHTLNWDVNFLRTYTKLIAKMKRILQNKARSIASCTSNSAFDYKSIQKTDHCMWYALECSNLLTGPWQ